MITRVLTCLRASLPQGLKAAAGILLALATMTMPAFACDVCAVYTPPEMQEPRTGLRLGVAEQFTHFGTLQNDGEEVPNPQDEYLDSSITQFVVGYQVHPRLLFQLNLPVIARHFRRATATGAKKGDENGIGDMSLIANVLVWNWMSEKAVVRFSLYGGIKFPTGNPDALKSDVPKNPLDLLNDNFGGGGFAQGGGAHSTGGGVHGHDIALGSGSFDSLMGAQVFALYDRYYWRAELQYTVRTRGSFGYEYADDLIVDAGTGVYLWRSDTYRVGLGAAVAADTKGKDNVHGNKLDDTGITSLYAGPALSFSWADTLDAEFVADLPAILNNTSLQIVPDYRIRAGLVWRF